MKILNPEKLFRLSVLAAIMMVLSSYAYRYLITDVNYVESHSRFPIVENPSQ